MAKFVFAYHGGGMPEDMSEEAVAKEMEAWGAWMGSLGEALIDGGNPIGQSKTVTAGGVTQGGGANPLSGYSLFEAADIDAAVAAAKGCPILNSPGGSIEVAEAIDM